MTSLDMKVSVLPDGRYRIEASWLEEPIDGETFFEAYWNAMVAKKERAK